MAILTVTITENVTLNGVDQGNSYSGFVTTDSITQVMRKNIKCTADAEITLYQAADATATTGTGAAWFDEDSIQYVRITNLNATGHYGWLRIQNDNGTPDEISYKLSGKQSLLLYSHATSLNAVDAAALTLGTGEGGIAKISFKPITNDTDIELFIASGD